MKFSPAARDSSNPQNIQAWQSETGKWRVEINRVMFGYRVNLTEGDVEPIRRGIALDYCAGASREWIEALATVIMAALLPFPEKANGSFLYAHFPRWKSRPMAKDPECWAALCQMALVNPAWPLEDIAEVDFDELAHMRTQLYLQMRFAGVENAHAIAEQALPDNYPEFVASEIEKISRASP